MAPPAHREWRALPLVTQATDGAFCATPEALQQMRHAASSGAAGGVRVLGVWGPPHSGKRLFLRTLLGAAASAFPESENADENETLLWLWVPVGGACDRVVISGSGGGENESPRCRDVRLALLLLLASALVYCADGELGARALAALDWLPHVAKVLRVRANQDEAGVASDFKTHAPKFLWLATNFKVKWLAADDGSKLTPLEYLEKSLKEESGFSDAVMARNATRMYFNSYFPARDCVALSRPLESVSAVASHTTERDELRAQFVESVDKFYSAYLSPKSNSALPAKQLMGSELRADQLAVVLETYVAALNANNLPTIAQASSTLLQRSIADGFEAARQIYDEAMAAVVASLDESSQALSSGELHVAHYRGAQQAMIRISELSASLPEQLRRAAFHDNLVQWESQLNSALATRVQQNQQLSRDASAALLERLLPHNLEEMASELASKPRGSFSEGLMSLLSQYKSDLRQAVEEYKVQASGPLAYEVLEQALLQSVHASITNWGVLVLQQYRGHIQSLTDEHDALERECAAAEAIASTATTFADDQKRKYEAQLEQSTKTLSDLRAHLRGDLNTKKSELERLVSDAHMMEMKHEVRVKNVENDIAWTRSRTAELAKAELEDTSRPESELSSATQSILTKERGFHEEERSLLTQQRDMMDRVAQLEREIAQKKSKHTQQKFALENAIARKAGDMKTEHAEFARQLKAQTKSDTGVLKLAFEKKKTAAQSEVDDVKREIEEVREKLALLSSPVNRAAPKKIDRDFFSAVSFSFPAIPVLPPLPEDDLRDSRDAGSAAKHAARAASFMDVSTSSATLGPNTATRMAARARSDSDLCKQS